MSELKNENIKIIKHIVIKDISSGWYVKDRCFGNFELSSLSFTPERENADKFDPDQAHHLRVINDILKSPFSLKIITITKTIIEFENEEENQ